MIDSIKVSEVTDVVTPAEETYPENYNFSMESTWEEQTFSAGGEGGITPTGSIDISENGTYDVTNYAEAVVDVESGGGGAVIEGASQVAINFASATLASDISIDIKGTASVYNFLSGANGSSAGTTVEITADSFGTTARDYVLKGSGTNISTVIFNSRNGIGPCFGAEATRNSNIENILGSPILYNIDASGNYKRFAGTKIKEIRFIPNKLGYSGSSVDSAVLSDASIISLANALVYTDSSKTLAVKTSVKTKMGTITGTVSTVTEDDVTYDFFTADANGSMTLTEFITTVKGWTLA